MPTVWSHNSDNSCGILPRLWLCSTSVLYCTNGLLHEGILRLWPPPLTKAFLTLLGYHIHYYSSLTLMSSEKFEMKAAFFLLSQASSLFVRAGIFSISSRGTSTSVYRTRCKVALAAYERFFFQSEFLNVFSNCLV